MRYELVVITTDGRFNYYSTKNKLERVRTVHTPHSRPQKIIPCGDKKTFLVLQPDGQLFFYDKDNGSRLLAQKENVSAVAITEDMEIIAIGCFDGSVTTYLTPGVKNNKVLTQLNKYFAHRGEVDELAFNNVQCLYSGAADEMVYMYDPVTGKQLQAFEGHTTAINTIIPINNTGVLTIGFETKNQVKIWRNDYGSVIGEISLPDLTVTAASLDMVNSRVVLATMNYVQAFDLLSLEPAYESHRTEVPIVSIVQFPAGDRYACIDKTGGIHTRSSDTGECLQSSALSVPTGQGRNVFFVRA